MARIGKDPAPAHGPRIDGESRPAAAAFVRALHDYTRRRGSSQIAVLEAGCGRPCGGLGLDWLRASGFDIRVTGVDHDHPLTREITAARADLQACTLGDLRTVPLPPRLYDIVHCARLLERIWHAELVLDRFVAALKPGGLLLLRTADRDCAAGAVDRFCAALPGRARERAWRRLRPGAEGPYPAVYERIVSGPGIQEYALLRGLVIAERHKIRRDLPAAGLWWRALGDARRFVAAASRGRYTDEHDELVFVMRKPEDRFARVL